MHAKKTAGVHALSGGARAKKSIDYAVMERTNLAALAPTDPGWSAADLIVCAARTQQTRAG
jgi:mannose-1-phosphate guanylyltransferase